jgi:hypothetical protein
MIDRVFTVAGTDHACDPAERLLGFEVWPFGYTTTATCQLHFHFNINKHEQSVSGESLKSFDDASEFIYDLVHNAAQSHGS